MAACSSDLMFRRVGNSSGKGDEIPRVQHFFRNSLWRVNGGVNAGQWGRAKPSPVCAVIELEARVRPGGDGRGFVTGAGVVDFAGFGIGSCGGRSCSGCRKQIDFVQMPSRVGFGSAFAQVRCDHRPEMVHPAPDGLIGNQDPAFRQQILDVAEAQREPNIEPCTRRSNSRPRSGGITRSRVAE
jgi:hypothetical protein